MPDPGELILPRSSEKTIQDNQFEFYRRTYGDPPPTVDTIKPIRELWGFQKDIIRHAIGLGSKAKSAEEIYAYLETQGIFVVEASKSNLLDKEKAGACRPVDLGPRGKVYQVKVSRWEDVAEAYREDQRTAQHIVWETFGHEAGHAMDLIQLPGISLWGTEARQQMFSQRYGNEIGDTKTISQGEEFFAGLQAFGSKIKT